MPSVSALVSMNGAQAQAQAPAWDYVQELCEAAARRQDAVIEVWLEDHMSHNPKPTLRVFVEHGLKRVDCGCGRALEVQVLISVQARTA